MIPTIEVGILSSDFIRFKLTGCFRCSDGKGVISEEIAGGEGSVVAVTNSFFRFCMNGKECEIDDFLLFEPMDEENADIELFDVSIGVKFHWERAEKQRFKGKMKILRTNISLTAINILPLELYLLSVISSEMSANSSVEFLKAHAVISRSWLLAQMEKGKRLKKAGEYKTRILNEDGYICWYDREEHRHFDVCADDHCQRYQGISKISSEQVYEAMKATAGEVLSYKGAVCDARFYKCCGGVTETFENVWEPVHHPYLTKVVDNSDFPEGYAPDLTKEENARAWITSCPPAYCNTRDEQILSQVLNDYDRETTNFFRWEVQLTQPEIQNLLFRKTGIDFGDIIDLIPVERGVSGRLIRLKIAGAKKTIVIGKELEIRKVLSESHLYSSAFIVEKEQKGEKIPEKFILKGAGWGHGVGLCQIGAAILGSKGYSYREILKHYFPGAGLEKIY
jgi:SpoIID/LytB domain protein